MRHHSFILRLGQTACLVALLPLLGASAPKRQYYGRVTGVFAGDRIEVTRQGRREHVRIYGVECPMGPWGDAARQFTRQMAGSRGVHLKIRDHDGHGSSFSEVRFIGGRSLGEELVRNGLAKWSRETAPSEKRLGRLESEARRSRKGFWADATKKRAGRAAVSRSGEKVEPEMHLTSLEHRTTLQ